MTLRQYLIIMSLATILCWIAWGLVLINIDPFVANAISFSFFYVSLFLALLGTTSLIAFTIYHFFSRAEKPMFRYVQKSFRYGWLISALLIGILFLQTKRLLNLWNLGLLVAVLILLVLFWFSARGGVEGREGRPDDNNA